MSNNIAARSAAAITLGVALAAVAIHPAMADTQQGVASTSEIGGRVTGPIAEDTRVYLVDEHLPVATPIEEGFALTNAIDVDVAEDGTYTAEVPQGRYRVVVAGSTLSTEWYPDKPHGRDATAVLTTPAKPAVVDLTPDAAGTIDGTLTAATGTVAGGLVSAYTADGLYAGHTRVREDGTFSVAGAFTSLPSGNYKLRFATEAGPIQWYGGSATIARAATVQLISGKATALTYAVKGDQLYAEDNVTISGKARAGSRLTAKSAWNLADAKLSYQWVRNGKAIKGATASTYKVATKDKGHRISVTVTASHPAHMDAAATSASVKISKR